MWCANKHKILITCLSVTCEDHQVHRHSRLVSLTYNIHSKHYIPEIVNDCLWIYNAMFTTDKVGFWATEQITYPGRHHCVWITNSLLVVVGSPDWLPEGVTNRESVTFTSDLICRVLGRGLGCCFCSLATVLIHSFQGVCLASLFRGPNVAGYIPSHRHLDFRFFNVQKKIYLQMLFVSRPKSDWLYI